MPLKYLNIIALGERVDILCLSSGHGSGYTIDDKTTGPRPPAMWIYGIFLKTCVFAKLLKNCASFCICFFCKAHNGWHEVLDVLQELCMGLGTPCVRLWHNALGSSKCSPCSSSHLIHHCHNFCLPHTIFN